MNEIKIVPLEEKYLKPAAKILAKTYFGHDNHDDETLSFIRDKISSKECFVALIGDEVAGFFVYWRDYSHYANCLTDLAVGEEYRKRGVAKKLLQKYIELCQKEQTKKQKYALSSTKKSNDVSIKMHTEFGFEVLGTIDKLHYGEAEIFFGYNLSK